MYEDTTGFSELIYSDEAYHRKHLTHDIESFKKSAESKYVPKAEFLLETLTSVGEDAGSMKCLDIGAGCGYMVYAYRQLGIDACGIDLSEHAVKYGNKILGGNYLKQVDLETMFSEIDSAGAQVLSFINVLEHIQDLRKTLAHISKASKTVKYIFFEVPTFSLSCILEVLNDEHFHRQLGSAHTHLFTKSSLKWIYSEYGFEPLAVWDFGSDVMDWYRFTLLNLREQGVSNRFIAKVEDFYKTGCDELQLAIDRAGFASGTIVLAKIKGQ